MRIIVFGATGRVGSSVVSQAVDAGHQVTVFVRDPIRVQSKDLQIYAGDARDGRAVARALRDGFDACLVCLGETALKPSNIMRDSVDAIVNGMEKASIKRLLMVSGTAEMPHKTRWGKIYTNLLKRTPVGHAIRDHDNAFEIIKASALDWTLVGCNYLKTGPRKASYKLSLSFPGGFKIIHPPDVADFLLKEMTAPRYIKNVVGIWY
jgi:uncharacterized protein